MRSGSPTGSRGRAPRSRFSARSSVRSGAPSSSRSPGMPCCCLQPARASLSSATTSSGACASPISCATTSRWTPMRKRLTAVAALRRAPLAPLPRNPRAMLTYDVSLAWTVLLLLAFGLVMVYSASIATAEASARTGYHPWYFLVRHAVFLAIGLAVAFFAFQVPVKVWESAAAWLFIGGALLLVLVLVPGIGRAVNGSRRWLP